MKNLTHQIQQDMQNIVLEWDKSDFLQKDHLFVVGCSTSEVAGKQIGSSGNEEIAAHIYEPLAMLAEQRKLHLAFQCCEHLNRALVVEKKSLSVYNLEEVAVVPVPEAGGAMAAYAFKQMENPVMVESVQAHAGMDIGDTLIGMQLKRVVVPLRFNQIKVGNAHLTNARTRPILIGGERAHY